jgi:hypothetical protein
MHIQVEAFAFGLWLNSNISGTTVWMCKEKSWPVECIWILWELYWQGWKFNNRSALSFNLHQESRVDWLVSFSQEKDWTLKTMNLTVRGLCTHPNIFMTRNNLNHVSGRDSLWYMTSNLCDLLMDKDPITQYETNFFECLCFSWKWTRYCSREREV